MQKPGGKQLSPLLQERPEGNRTWRQTILKPIISLTFLLPCPQTSHLY